MTRKKVKSNPPGIPASPAGRRRAGKRISDRYIEKILILLLFLIPLIYFAPFLSPNRMIAGSDYLIGGYPFDKWAAEQSSIPLWYPQIFGGMPVLGAPTGGPLAPSHQLKNIIPPQVVMAIGHIIFLFIGGLGVYLYLKSLKVSQYVAFIGSIAYIFIGNNLSTPYAGHLGRAVSVSLFPFAVFFLQRGLVSKKIFYFLMAGTVSALAFYEGHFQMTYYALLFAFAYLMFFLVSHRRENGLKVSIRLFSYSILTVVFMVCLVSAIWLPTISGLGTAARGVTRGYEYSTSWAMPPLEFIDLVVPTFSGLLNNYWGANYFKLHTEYMGVFPLVLLLIGIFYCFRKSLTKFYLGALIVSVLIALGGHTPFFRIPYHLIPGFKFFRGPAMIFYLAAFSIIVIGALGLESVKQRRFKPEEMKKFAIVMAIAIGIYLIIGVILSSSKGQLVSWCKTSFYQQKIGNFEQNYSSFVAGIWRTFLLLIIFGSIVLLIAGNKIQKWAISAIAIPIIMIDCWTIERRFLPYGSRPEVYYRADEVVNFLKQDKGFYRVFPFQYQHAQDSYLMYHNISSVGGYVPNPIQKYQDLIGAGTSVMFNAPNLVRYRNILDILNVKYVISVWIPEELSQYDERTQKEIENFKLNFLRRWGISWQDAHSRLRLVFRDRKGQGVYENETALPKAWVVHNFKVVPEEKVLEELKNPDFDPRATVILEETVEVRRQKTEDIPMYREEEVRIVEYTPNKIIIEVKLTSPGFLVLSENWHPDWKAYIDTCPPHSYGRRGKQKAVGSKQKGKRVKVYIANYTLRAVQLDKGKHTVEFVYDSPYFKAGATVSFLSFLFLLGIIGFWVKRGRKNG